MLKRNVRKDNLKTNKSKSYSKLNYKLETFCSLVNEKHNFDADYCEDGYLEFKVPLDWLIDFLNSENNSVTKKNKELSSLSDLNKWNSKSTYYETEFIFREAVLENMLIGEPIVHGCTYCKKAFLSSKKIKSFQIL